MLTITIDQLISLNACEPAIELFLAEFGGSLNIPEYTPQHQEWLVRSEWRKYLDWAWLTNVLPQWSMCGVDLRGARLCEAGLCGVNLTGAYLGWANLLGANLSRANLSGANLSNVNLREARLLEASLSRSNMRGANLSGAYLGGASLFGADLCGAYLGGANLVGADLSWARATSAVPGWDLVDGVLRRSEVSR